MCAAPWCTCFQIWEVLGQGLRRGQLRMGLAILGIGRCGYIKSEAATCLLGLCSRCLLSVTRNRHQATANIQRGQLSSPDVGSRLSFFIHHGRRSSIITAITPGSNNPRSTQHEHSGLYNDPIDGSHDGYCHTQLPPPTTVVSGQACKEEKVMGPGTP